MRVTISIYEVWDRNAIYSAVGFEDACSGPSHSQKKTRTQKRKYTRTKEAWEARAASRCAKLTAKYDEPTEREDIVDRDESTYHFNRGIAADFVRRVLACACDDAVYVDFHCESAVLLREYNLKA